MTQVRANAYLRSRLQLQTELQVDVTAVAHVSLTKMFARGRGASIENWSMLLQSVLIGKAREVYTQLSVQQSANYEIVKELILKAYELVPEAYRQKFRNLRKDSNQTHVEFARNKEQLFDRWCLSKKIDEHYDNLRQLMLIEEFKRCIHPDIKTYLDEQKAETLEDAARYADDYSLTHKVSFGRSNFQFLTKRFQTTVLALRLVHKNLMIRLGQILQILRKVKVILILLILAHCLL